MPIEENQHSIRVSHSSDLTQTVTNVYFQRNICSNNLRHIREAINMLMEDTAYVMFSV